MGATESERANTLWLRLKLLLDTDREVIHSDQMDLAPVFFIYLFLSIDCAVAQ